MLEDGDVTGRRGEGGHIHAIHTEGHSAAGPNHSVGVKCAGWIGDRGAGGGLDGIAARPQGGVKGVPDGVGVAGGDPIESATPFHHIDLTASWPRGG